MKAYVLMGFLFILTLASVGSAAQRRPGPSHYMVTCNSNGGIPYVEINVPGDTLPFCTVGGGLVGADVIERWVYDKISTRAREAFLSNSGCATGGGVIISGTSICQFGDGSVIAAGVLGSGNPSLRALLR